METWFVMCQLRANVSKTRAGKAYTYRMLLSFKTSVTYKKNYVTPDNCVRCEAAFVGHNSIFCRALFDVRC